MVSSKPKHNRQTILALKEMAHVQEALVASAEAQQRMGHSFDIFRPIRETPLSIFFDKSEGSFESGRINPHLPTIWKHRYGIRIGDEARGNMRIGGKELKETVSVPNSLSALKIADEILEGAEPWSDWKQYSRLIDMDAPKINVPLTKYTDVVGGGPASADQKSLDIYKEAGGTPPAIGGKITTVSLDTSGTNNSFRGTIAVNRNDVKDNNFLAVEQSLKNAGNEFYFMIGKKIIDVLALASASPPVPSETKANLANTTPEHEELEALVEVIRSRFPGTQRNRADTMFINPADAAKTVKTASMAGFYPFFSRFELGPTDDTDVINNSGLAQSLGLRAVWETPQIDAGTVLITKRDIASVVGLREDLTIENFDLQPGGLYQSDLVVRIDVKRAHADVGAFRITSY